jgi:hypothetical protein
MRQICEQNLKGNQYQILLKNSISGRHFIEISKLLCLQLKRQFWGEVLSFLLSITFA